MDRQSKGWTKKWSFPNPTNTTKYPILAESVRHPAGGPGLALDYGVLVQRIFSARRKSRSAARLSTLIVTSSQKGMNMGSDPIKHPPHYTRHPSGIECIEITKHMNFCLGNAVKYIWRADLKNGAIEDLKKARQYLDFEIERRTNTALELESERSLKSAN